MALSAFAQGVIVIHAVVTSNNYALFMERPGNRENAVRPWPVLLSCPCSQPADLTLTAHAAKRWCCLQPERQHLHLPGVSGQPLLLRFARQCCAGAGLLQASRSA